MSGFDLFNKESESIQVFRQMHKNNLIIWNRDTPNHACLLLDTFVVTAVTEAREMVSGSGPNMPLGSRFCVSRMAGSSGGYIKYML